MSTLRTLVSGGRNFCSHSSGQHILVETHQSQFYILHSVSFDRNLLTTPTHPHNKIINYRSTWMGRYSSVVIETRYRLDRPGIESRWGSETSRTPKDRPWGSPGLLYSGYLGLSGCGVVLTINSLTRVEVNERVELYQYASPSRAFTAGYRVNFTPSTLHKPELPYLFQRHKSPFLRHQ